MKLLIESELQRVWTRSKTKAILIILILITLAWSSCMRGWNVGFYDANNTMALNSLNLPVFILRDIHPALMFVFLPMLYVDGLNVEHTQGGYRNVMTRPYKKWQFIISKLIVQAIVTAIALIIIFIVSSLFGNLFFNSVESTKFFKNPNTLNFFGTLIYSLKFYSLEFLILFALLSVSSLICSIVPNGVLGVLLTIAFPVGTIYISDVFEFFLSSTKTIFDALGNSAPLSFYGILSSIIIIGIGGSIFLWQKKDWVF